MKLKKILLVAAMAALPVIGWSKSSQQYFQFGDTELEPEDSITFSLESAPDAIGGYEVLDEYLPDSVDVMWTGKKFKLPKAGRVKYSKKDEDFVSTSDDNPCGLKLSINKKSGKVKGSFKVYVAKSEKKLKSYSAKVAGTIGGTLVVAIGGSRYGATLE